MNSRFGQVMIVVAALICLASALPARAQGGGTLTFDGPVTATLAQGETHNYTFHSEGGEVLTARMTAASDSTVDPVLELLDSAGTLLAFNDDETPGIHDAGLVDVMLADAGDYTLVARSYGGRGAGAYTLAASLETAPAVAPATPIALNSTVNGQILTGGQADRWAFNGTAGQVISVAMNHAAGTSLDPLVELQGPDGTVLIYSDDDGGDLNSLISGFTLPQDGLYTIVARSWGNTSTGAYTLQFAEGFLSPTVTATAVPGGPYPQGQPPVNQTGLIQPGQTVQGTLLAGMMDEWTLTVEIALTVRIAMTSPDGELDTLLEVANADGALLVQDDDGGDGLNSLIRALSLPQPGQYTIRARSFSDQGSGPYTLSVQETQPVAANSGNIEPGQTISATLAYEATDTWTLVAQADEIYTIALYATSGEFDTIMHIVDVLGVEVSFDDDGGPGLNSMLRGWSPPADGPYVIRVGSFSGDGEGDYTLTVARGEGFIIPDVWQQGSLTLDQTVESTFSGTSTHAWTFEGRADQYYALDYSGMVSAEVLTADGDSIAYVEVGQRFPVPQDGTYYILVYGYSADSYSLTLSEQEPPPINTGNIEAGQTITATLAESAQDAWTFVGQAGQTISIGAYAVDNAFDTVLSVVTTDGQEVAYDDDGGIGVNSLINGWTLPVDGPYIIHVRGYSGWEGGPYTLTVQMGNVFVLPDTMIQGTLVPGGTIESAFEETNLIHVWRLEIGTNQHLILDFSDTLSVEVLNAHGDSFGTAASGMPFPVDAGLCYVVVYGSYAEPYTLKVRGAG